VARLQHPNIVQVFEVGEAEGTPYLALEFLEGGSLDRILVGKPQPPAAAASLVETLARAIHHAHERGIVHRDLKPANVLLQKKEGNHRGTETTERTRKEFISSDCSVPSVPLWFHSFSPKISDFGLAKLLEAGAGVTASGTPLGTASYMPPEQARAEADSVGPAADVYALGAILYELLTGRPPFEGASAAETMLRVLTDDPVAPGRLRPRLPRDLETICLKCLEKTPGRRYASARSLADDLARFLAGEPIEARPVGARERVVKWARRRPAVAALTAVTAALTFFGFGMVTWQWQEAERARSHEEEARQVAVSAGEQAEAARAEEAEQRQRYQRLSLSLAVDRGLHLCEQGEVGRGLLLLARCLEWGHDEPEGWQRVIRTNVSAWTQSLCSMTLRYYTLFRIVTMPALIPEVIMRRLAVSYSRYSSPQQDKGDSMERQEELFRAFCRRHDLAPLGEIYADKGRSGYKDEHRKKGRLGELIAAAKDGRFEPGTVIVVEAWDRLGRLRPDRQTELVAELLRTGVSIGVCRLDDVFSEGDFATHKWTTLAVFIQLAFQESLQKSDRVADSWRRRRERAREDGRLLTSRLPAWVEQSKEGLRLIPDRTEVVRRIFALAAEGYGDARIVQTLTREGVPTFGEVVVREGRSRSQYRGRWTRTYIRKLLNDRRATGELQPKTIDGKAAGAPIANYYPAAVGEDDFLLARAGQDARRVGPKGKGRQSRHVNVFKGLLTHARDGQSIVLYNSGPRGLPRLTLANITGIEGRSRRYTIPYLAFEEAILGRLRELDPREVLPRDEPAPRVDVLRARLAAVRADLARLEEDLKAGYSKALGRVLRAKEEEEEQAGRDLQDELARSVRPAARVWGELPGLVEMIRTADDPDAVRLRLAVALRRLVEGIVALPMKAAALQFWAVQVRFAGSEARRDYLVARLPPGRGRAG
jgi:DNA invertase Pin-like site-specific DNA recombinase